ncbi:MAG TPA: SUMF1/EgtB/PvdO family nonheme iron enzyme, partial [Polyangiaceae bacterium]|nr:SUMF1/EgtB/PvdO family nonheme iron enzyme [Polyangiaceae bacterium]
GALFCSGLGAATVLVATHAGSTDAPRASEPPGGAAAGDPSASRAGAAASNGPGVTGPGSTRASIASAAARCPAHTVWIAGGAFSMGSDSQRPALSLARPPHAVTVRGFCLDTHEVTSADYAACADAGDCTPAHATTHFAEASEAGNSPASVSESRDLCNAERPGRERHPINCVSHDQAAAYCAMRGGRLPTEAEWEFAARGVSSRAFPWGDELPTRAHVNACGKECERWHEELGVKGDVRELMYAADDGYAGTAPVGSFPRGRSPEGVDDLIGNVFEWTAEGLYPYDRSPATDPRGPADADAFVIRGGNFNSALREFLDPALRFAMHRDSYSHGVGFRCAAEPLVAGPSTLPSSLTR